MAGVSAATVWSRVLAVYRQALEATAPFCIGMAY
jgi:hypothetical protein